ncbi:DJ-1/PfpI family protein [Candidatus Phytoplasma oryzae]|uniref:DJ-1/PfpI family protein n=1 Tax=Candidatus Phytoplasma oryzae TaxID=203274 RepID=A0A139JQB9_9MOLU|nr:DJ-1/PfpI family protein [Candidatus Phytoplasma oryzae]KXT29162.1 DJ-1/PfpI family protein [Candidatus Phytoplasma oryzae]
MTLYNNFQEIEALVTRNTLIKQPNIEIITTTPNLNLEVTSSHGLTIKANKNINSIDFNKEKYDFLILPGGPYVKELLDQNDKNLKKLLEIVHYFFKNKKIIAAICAAPAFLGKIGLLKNKKFTCFPGYQKYIEGIYCSDKKAIISDNFITSRSPETVLEFSQKILSKLLF